MVSSESARSSNKYTSSAWYDSIVAVVPVHSLKVELEHGRHSVGSDESVDILSPSTNVYRETYDRLNRTVVKIITGAVVSVHRLRRGNSRSGSRLNFGMNSWRSDRGSSRKTRKFCEKHRRRSLQRSFPNERSVIVPANFNVSFPNSF